MDLFVASLPLVVLLTGYVVAAVLFLRRERAR